MKELILTDSQCIVYNKVMGELSDDEWGLHASLSGPSGSGKTTLSKKIVESLLEEGKRVAITATTHQAVSVIVDAIDIEPSSNIQYGTIHSFLKLKPGEIDENTGERKFIKEKNSKSKLGKFNCDILIIDESSMISSELKNFISSEPSTRFKKILFIGDKYQLLSVEKNENNNKSVIFDDSTIKLAQLTEIIRQKDMETQDFLTSIRTMIENKKSKRDFITFLKRESNKTHNKITFHPSIKGFLMSFTKRKKTGIIGTFTNNKVNTYNKLMHEYHTGSKEELVKGDIIVIQSTYYDKHYNMVFQNSQRIKIKSVKKYKQSIIEHSSVDIEVLKVISEDNIKFTTISESSEDKVKNYLNLLIKQKRWKDYYYIKDNYIDWKHNYASTIHKLQGSTIDDVWIDCRKLGFVEADMLLRLAYVGFSRAKNNIHILMD